MLATATITPRKQLALAAGVSIVAFLLVLWVGVGRSVSVDESDAGGAEFRVTLERV
jgi:hypothetical protein